MPYYIKNRGKAFGPFSEQQLVELKTKGKIGRNAEVSEDQANWFTAESLPFLGFAPQMVNSGTSAAANSITTTADESPEWFYSTDGKAGYGPVTETVIRQMLQEGTLTGNSFVWTQGAMAQAINTVTEFAGSGRQQQTVTNTAMQVNASKFCSACGTPLVASAAMCPQCGSPVASAGFNIASSGPKSRFVYVLLAVFLFGAIGFHNFYAGRTNTAIWQLLLGLTGLVLIVPLMVTAVWALIEAITVTTDGQGRPFV